MAPAPMAVCALLLLLALGGCVHGAGPTVFQSLNLQLPAAGTPASGIVSANEDNGAANPTVVPPIVIPGVLALSSSASSDPHTLYITTNQGSLSLAQTTGLTFSEGTGVEDIAVNATGTVSDLSAAVASLSLHAPNYEGIVLFSATLTDVNGASTTGTIQVLVNGVNDRPQVTATASFQIAEDTTGTFSVALEDVDADANDIRVILESSQAHGVIEIPDATGIAFADGTGQNQSRVVLESSQASLSTALAAVQYHPDADYNGPDSVVVTVNDLGQSGVGSDQQVTATVTVLVTAVNDAPTVTAPANGTLDEGSTFEFSNAQNTSITVADDAEESAASVRVTVSVTHGILDLAAATVTILSAGGSYASTITFQGIVHDVNDALDGLVYAPLIDTYASTDQITITVDDLGSTGTGGALSITTTIDLTIVPDATNDAPVLESPAPPLSTDEDVSLFVTGFSVFDDSLETAVEFTLELTGGNAGQLFLSTTADLSPSAGADGSASMTFTGSQTAIRAALANITYTPAADFFGTDSIRLTVNDLGATGSGGAQSSNASVPVTVASINDPPVVTLTTATPTTDEDTPLDLGAIVSVSDVDVFGGELEVNITVESDLGTVSTGAAPAGATVTGSGTRAITLRGNLTQVTALVAGLVFEPALNYHGTVGIDVSVSDEGNSGAGGAQLATAQLTVDVASVNDAPEHSGPAVVNADENTVLNFTSPHALAITDVDAVPGDISTALSVSVGTLRYDALAAAALVSASGQDTQAVAFSGSLASVNAALATLQYVPPTGFAGGDTLTWDTNDNGNSGTGGNQSDSSTIPMIVAQDATNNAPVFTPTANVSTAEETEVDIVGPNVYDDAADALLNVTVSSPDGTFSLDCSGLSNPPASPCNNVASVSFLASQAEARVVFHATIPFLPDPNIVNPDAFVLFTVDDLGWSTTGGVQAAAQNASHRVFVSVGPVNDAPVVTVPKPLVYLTEDSPLAVAFTVSDPDVAAAGPEQLTLSVYVDFGTLYLDGAVAGTSSPSSVTTDGSPDALNALNVTYVPPQHFTGTARIQIDVDDNGNTGAGSALTASKNVSVVVNATNDAPIIVIPASLPVVADEDFDLALSGIAISDVELGQDTVGLTVNLSTTDGTLRLPGTNPGVTLSPATANVTAAPVVQLFGSPNAVNLALDALVYRPNADFEGATSVQVDASDGGFTGAGGVRSASATVPITVVALNDPPVITAPAPQVATDEDVTFAFVGANATSIDDVDAGGAAALTVFLQLIDPALGSLSLPAAAGLVFLVGDGTEDAVLRFEGNLSTINTALASLLFVPAPHQSGFSDVLFNVTDNGNTGGGGAGTDVTSFGIQVVAVNDVPVNTVPAMAQAATEDAPHNLYPGAIAVADVEPEPLEVTVSADASATVTVFGGPQGSATVTGNGTGTVVLNGSQTDINAILYLTTIATPLDFNGNVTVTVTTVDAGSATDDDSFVVVFEAVNDDPEISLASSVLQTDEDQALDLASTVSFSDVDVGATNNVSVTVEVTGAEGTLTVTFGGAAGTSVTGSGTASIAVEGPLSSANAAVTGLVFTPNADYFGNVSVAIGISDNGHSGSGGGGTVTSALTIEVSPINDDPEVAAPAALQTAPEDVAIVFSAANNNSITFSDIDAAGFDVRITLELSPASAGTLELNSTAGLTFVTGQGSGSSVVTFDATVAEANAAVAGLVFHPTEHSGGFSSLVVTINDQGNFGSGGAVDVNATVDLRIVSVNDAPTLAAQNATLNEDVFTALPAIALEDVDAQPSDGFEAALAVAHGVLTFPAAASLVFVSGANNSASVYLSASYSDLQTVLASLSYVSDANYFGADALSVDVHDLGHNGDDNTNLTASLTQYITVRPVNDDPVLTSPATNTSTTEDTIIPVSAGKLDFSIADLDVANGTNNVTVTVQVVNGVASLAQTSGLAFAQGTGTGDAVVQFTAQLEDANAALTLAFAPDLNFVGTASIFVTVSDNGNFGLGGPATASGSVFITVTDINDPPVLQLPARLEGEEDAPTFVSGVTVSDVDLNGSPLRATVVGSDGVITITNTTGLTIVDADGDNTTQFLGPIAVVQGALNSLRYDPTEHSTGVHTVRIVVSDDGVDRVGGRLSASGSIPIDVNAVNDAPEVTAPAMLSGTEENDLALNGSVTVYDLDAGGRFLMAVVSVDEGTITLGPAGALSGVTFIIGDGIADDTVRFTGPQTAINAVLTGAVFTPPADFFGNATLSVTINDQANSGDVSIALEDSADVTLYIAPVNDQPRLDVPAGGPLETPEDTPLAFGSGAATTITAWDDGPLPITLTLSAVSGTLQVVDGPGIAVAGNGTASAQAQGNLAEIQAVLDALRFVPSLNVNGVSIGAVVATLDDGSLSVTDFVNVTITAVNDAPTVAVEQATVSTDEDTPVTITNTVVADVDVLTTLHVTIYARHGAVEVSNSGSLAAFNASVQGVDPSGNPATVTEMRDAPTAINAALASVVFTPDADFNGDASVRFVADDEGQSPGPAALQGEATVLVAVSPVNDAPTLTGSPADKTMNEDGSAISVAGFTFADKEATTLQVTLSVSHGVLSLAGPGLTFSNGSTGTNDATVVFSATTANALFAVSTLTYKPDADFYGDDAVIITVSDLGAEPAPAKTVTNGPAGVTISVAGVNDAPTIESSPASSHTIDEDASSLDLSGFQVADKEATDVEVTVTCSHGVLAVTPGSLTYSGDGTASITVSGAIVDVNTALDTLTYAPNTNYNGADAVVLTVSDLGASPGPAALTATNGPAGVAITINAVNDAPTIDSTPTLPLNTNEDTQLALGGFSVSDVEASTTLEVEVGVQDGTLAVDTSNVFVSSGGTGGASIVFQGSPTNVNAALDTLVYTPDANFNGDDTLSLTVSDLGVTPAPEQTTTDSWTITVAAVNDAPTIESSPASSFTIDEDASSLDLSGFEVADVEAADVEVTVTCSHGVLAVTPGSLTYSGDGTASITVSGAIADINTALATLAYDSDDNYNGADAVVLTVSDLGVGPGPAALTATNGPAGVAITINAVNDAPTIESSPASSHTIDEDASSLDLSGFEVADVEASDVAVTVTCSHGALAVTPGSLTYSGDGTASISVSGAIADINTALATLSYAPDTNYNGADAVVLTVSDLGASPGPAKTATNGPAGIAITINAINDGVTLVVPQAEQQAFEEDALHIAGITVTDVDATVLRAVLTSSHGTLTLGSGASLVYAVQEPTELNVTGSVADVLSALAALQYTPDESHPGTDVISVYVDDQGTTGTGGVLSSDDTIDVRVDCNDGRGRNDNDVCAPCPAGTAGTGGTCSITCEDGERQTHQRTECEPCPHWFVGTGGVCNERCLPGTVRSEDLTSCDFCPDGFEDLDLNPNTNCTACLVRNCNIGRRVRKLARFRLGGPGLNCAIANFRREFLGRIFQRHIASRARRCTLPSFKFRTVCTTRYATRRRRAGDDDIEMEAEVVVEPIGENSEDDVSTEFDAILNSIDVEPDDLIQLIKDEDLEQNGGSELQQLSSVGASPVTSSDDDTTKWAIIGAVTISCVLLLALVAVLVYRSKKQKLMQISPMNDVTFVNGKQDGEWASKSHKRLPLNNSSPTKRPSNDVLEDM